MSENLDRFVQEFDLYANPEKTIKTAEMNLADREFLDVGTIVILKNFEHGKVSVIDRAVTCEGKVYDYLGKTIDLDTTSYDVYFNEENIEEYEKKEGKVL